MQRDRIGSSDALTVEIGKAIYHHILGHGQRQPALGESKLLRNGHLPLFFHQQILAHDGDVGHPIFEVLWDVVIAQIEHIEWKVAGTGLQLVLAVVDNDAAVFEQLHRVFVEAT